MREVRDKRGEREFVEGESTFRNLLSRVNTILLQSWLPTSLEQLIKLKHESPILNKFDGQDSFSCEVRLSDPTLKSILEDRSGNF